MLTNTSSIFQIYLPNTRSPSPLLRLGLIIMTMYVFGIGIFLWSINFRCKIQDTAAMDDVVLSYQSWTVIQKGNYVFILNYVRAELSPKEKETITFVSAATYTDMHHVTEVCKRWRGPLSVAVYAPGSDFKASLRALFRLRLGSNPCVRQNVTWHFYFDAELGPSFRHLKPPEVEAALTNVEDGGIIWPRSSFRSHIHLPFPANMGRNAALQQSYTHYVLIADLNFYPSENMIPWFFKLIKKENWDSRRVYVLPVFKMSAKGDPPPIKSELIKLAAKGKIAIPVGTSDCTDCYVFPKANGWLDAEVTNNTMSVYHVTKRSKDFASWQPFFISSKNIPMLENQMTKDGRQDRVTQALELCLQWYDFYIVDNAFLVQVPESDEHVAEDATALQTFVNRNNKLKEKILEELTCKYGLDTNC